MFVSGQYSVSRISLITSGSSAVVVSCLGEPGMLG